jgi:hypothetical protein
MAIYDLVKLIFLILFMGHFTGCSFYLLTKFESNIEETWIANFGFLEQSWYDKYVASFYWGSITMITVGYGVKIKK